MLRKKVKRKYEVPLKKEVESAPELQKPPIEEPHSGLYEIVPVKEKKVNIPLLSELASFIESVFQHTAPTVAKAAGEAAAGAAVSSAEADPKVQAVTQASVALLAAAKNLKTTIDAAQPPVPPLKPAA